MEFSQLMNDRVVIGWAAEPDDLNFTFRVDFNVGTKLGQTLNRVAHVF